MSRRKLVLLAAVVVLAGGVWAVRSRSATYPEMGPCWAVLFELDRRTRQPAVVVTHREYFDSSREAYRVVERWQQIIAEAGEPWATTAVVPAGEDPTPYGESLVLMWEGMQ